VFLAQFQYNSSHDVFTQHLVYLSLAAIKWTVFICSWVSVGHLHFLYRHYVYYTDGGSCFFTFQMFPPILWHCNTEEEENSTLYKPTM